MNYRFKELVDIPRLQELTDELHLASSIPSAIVAMDGEILTQSGWRRICDEFHRRHPRIAKECLISDAGIGMTPDEDEPFSVYKCPTGLLHASSPIIIDGERVANVFSGQIFLEPSNLTREQYFKEQAREFGFDETDYIHAFEQVPIFTEKRFRAALSFVARLTQMIVNMGLARIKELESAEATRKSEKKASDILESIHDGFFSLDDDLVVTYFNKAAERLLGRKSEEVLGKKLFDSFPGARGSLFEERHRRAVKEKKRTSFETHLGEAPYENWFDVRVQPLENGISVYFQTITERKRAEQEIKQFRTISDRAVHGNAIVDLQGAITYINDYFARVHGYTPEEVIGRDLSVFHNEKQMETVRRINRDLTETGSYGAIEVWHTHKDGSEFPMLMSGVVIRDENGEPKYLAATAIDISELREAREEAARMLRFLETAIDHIPIPVIIAGAPDVAISHFNQAAVDLLTKTPDDVREIPLEAQREFWPTFYPDGTPYRVDDMPLTRATRRGESIRDLEMIIRREDGDHWVSASAAPLRDEEGGVIAGIVAFPDITDRKRAVEALRKREERYGLLFNSGNDAVFVRVLGGEGLGKFTEVNDVACLRLGYDREELLRMSPVDIDAEEMNEARRRALETMAETGHCVFEMVHAGKSGRRIPVEISSRVFESEGERHVLSIARDITERKRAEEALRTERDKLKGVLNGVGEGMYIVSRDFTIEYQNDILENLFPGGTGAKCFATYMETAAPCETCKLHEAITSGEIQQLEMVFANGRDYDITFSPFADKDGEIKAIILARDISEKKILQAEAARAGQLASLGELAAGVAHEINNPMNGIISYAELLKDEFDEKGEDAEIPVRIIKEGERVAAIVKNLLSFAREQNGGPAPVHPHEILSDALGLVESRIRLDGIQLTADVPTDLPVIIARTHEIQQVFLNLISNARYALGRKFPNRRKGKTLDIKGETVEVRGRQYVRTTFRDAGPGIPETILGKIINPFFSTKPSGQGTGLGLSISHGIIQSHGGALRFESVEGEYTKAIVDLPVGGRVK